MNAGGGIEGEGPGNENSVGIGNLGGANAGLGGGETPTGNQGAQTPTGGTETASYDPLKMVSDDLLNIDNNENKNEFRKFGEQLIQSYESRNSLKRFEGAVEKIKKRKKNK